MPPPPSNEVLYPLEPEHSALLSTIQAQEPFNAEAPVSDLVEFSLTPEELVYARNHGPVREFDEDEYQLSVRLEDGKEFKLTVSQLKRDFEHVEVVAVLQCAGNRRKEMASDTGKKVSGVPWDDAVIANCLWTGVRVKDVLTHAGITLHDDLHVHFASYATLCQDDDYYGASLPLSKAMGTDDQVLIAWDMNSSPLSPAHGGPLRLVVPGYLGARWVKWLDTIIIANNETPNFYMQRDYKVLPPEVDTKPVAAPLWSKYPAMTALPLNSVVATVIPTESNIFVKGYALPSYPDPYREPKASNNIAKVEISIDDGQTWHQAKITYQEGKWSWTIWEAELDIALLCPGQSIVQVVSRAVDTCGNVQPKQGVWNLRGVAWNSWGRKKVDLYIL